MELSSKIISTNWSSMYGVCGSNAPFMRISSFLVMTSGVTTLIEISSILILAVALDPE
ncbi:hypothetical protein ES703_104752 [subsurface metagenome]